MDRMSNEVTVPTPQASNINTVTRASNIIISVLAICGNMLTLLIFARERKLLKKPYNILILTLSISDVLTAINVITNPAYVLGDAFPYPTNPIITEIVCRLIWSRAIIFHLVFFSVYITLVLAAERWYAVVKPHSYKDVFSRQRVLGYIAFSWAWSALLMAKHIKGTVYVPSSQQICQFAQKEVGSMSTMLWNAIQIFLKMLLPCITVICLYIHMIVKTNNSPFASAESKSKLRGKVTRMVGASSFILIAFFVPNQVFYFLRAAGKVKFDTWLHHFFSLLTFMTLCVNPIVYGMSNKNYQQRYRRLLFALCPRSLRNSNRVLAVGNANLVPPRQAHHPGDRGN